MQGNIKTTVELYNGSNEYLNTIYDIDMDGPVYIVNSRWGRKPIMANSPSQAIKRYMELYDPAQQNKTSPA